MKKIILIMIVIFSLISCIYADYYEDPNEISDTEITDFQVKKVAFILVGTIIISGFGITKVIDFWCILFLLAFLGIIFDFEDLELSGAIIIGMVMVCYQAIRDFIRGDRQE